MQISNQKNKVRNFQKKVLEYYQKHGRDLPWRKTDDPYAILVSEIMLQQTQVDRVIPKYHLFLKMFSTMQSLAQAQQAEVLTVWQGLGYNRRALFLKRMAEVVMKEHDGTMPTTVEQLEKLPGIGAYTARAVCAFAHNQSVAMIETNIRRSFIYHFFPRTKKVDDKKLMPLVAAAVPKDNVRIWYNALMDYGSMLAVTTENPNRRSKGYTKPKKFAGSDRQARGKILKLLLIKKKISLVDESTLPRKSAQMERVITGLVKEGFMKRDGDTLILV